MNHVAFVVKSAIRSFTVTLGVLTLAPNGGRAVKAGALSQATGAQRKTAIRAALIAAGLPETTEVLVVEAAPPVGCRVVTTATVEPPAPKAEPKAETRREWLTPAQGDGTAWLAAYQAIVKANHGRPAGIYRDCHAQQVACGAKWLDWARTHGIFAKAPKAPKVKVARTWDKEAAAYAAAEQNAAKIAAKSAGLDSKSMIAWSTAVYKAAYNFGLEAVGKAHRYSDIGTEAPAMPSAAPAKKAA